MHTFGIYYRGIFGFLGFNGVDSVTIRDKNRLSCYIRFGGIIGKAPFRPLFLIKMFFSVRDPVSQNPLLISVQTVRIIKHRKIVMRTSMKTYHVDTSEEAYTILPSPCPIRRG